MATTTWTAEEVSKHNTRGDCWIVLGNAKTGGAKVYDVTVFLDSHPGGPQSLLDYAGKNARPAFESVGHSSSARQMLEQFLIGDFDGVAEEESTSQDGGILSYLKFW